MTKIELNIADDLANKANEAGLFERVKLEAMLSEELKRQAGQRLRENMARIHAVPGEPMTMDEVCEEVRAYRRERHEAKAANVSRH